MGAHNTERGIACTRREALVLPWNRARRSNRVCARGGGAHPPRQPKGDQDGSHPTRTRAPDNSAWRRQPDGRLPAGQQLVHRSRPSPAGVRREVSRSDHCACSSYSRWNTSPGRRRSPQWPSRAGVRVGRRDGVAAVAGALTVRTPADPPMPPSPNRAVHPAKPGLVLQQQLLIAGYGAATSAPPIGTVEVHVILLNADGATVFADHGYGADDWLEPGQLGPSFHSGL